jgi:hypothetical protein
VDRPRDLTRVGDQEAVLDGRHRDADRVRFLEAIGAQQLGADLAGEEDHRDRVHHRVHDRRDQVGRAGARGREGDADLAGRLRVALGRVARAGLVPDEDMMDVRIDEGVVGRKVGATRISEYDVHALRLQALHDRVDCTHSAQPPSHSSERFT